MTEMERGLSLPHASGLTILGRPNSVRVGRTERAISLVAAGALTVLGVRKLNPWGLAMVALGGALAYRGATGHCALYQALDINTANPDDGHTVVKGGVKVEKAIIINRSPEELYRFWRDFENLPRFMRHVKTVKIFDTMHSHWVARAPAGTSVEWDAEIINEQEGRMIAWRSTDNATIANTGSVHFDPAPGDRGTVVRVALQYDPPAGELGAAIAKLFGEEPSIQIEEDLQRFKQLMEAGEFPTTDGQSHG
jgi:uncharacterized membrane protein